MTPQITQRLTAALDTLTAQWLTHPAVSLIDIGYPPQPTATDKKLVLRIHVRNAREVQDQSQPHPLFPTEVDGIPVIVMSAAYAPHTGAQHSDALSAKED